MLRRTLQVVGVRVQAAKAGKVVKKLNGYLLNLPKLRNVVPDPQANGMKLVLLSTSVCSPETLQPLRETLKSFLCAGSFSFVSHAVQMDCSEDAKEKEAVGKSGETANHEEQVVKIGDVSFRPVGNDNVEQLREMNVKLFPVRYGKEFYEYVADAPEGYCKLAYSEEGTAIGSVCCEVEKVKISGKQLYRLLILTIGVVKENRRSKLGSLLLESVLAQARKDSLAYVYLHVQSTNTAAQRFYFSHGFEVTALKRNYYSQLDSPHGFVFRKSLSSTM